MNAGCIGSSGSRRTAVASTLVVLAAAVLLSVVERRHEPAGAPAPETGTAVDPQAKAIVVERGFASAPPGASAPDARVALLAAVNRLQQAHRFGEAEALLSDWLVHAPGDARALLVRSQLRIHAGSARGALADCMVAAAGLDALAASGCVAQARGALGDVRGARVLVETALAHAAEDGADDATASWASGIAAELAARDRDDESAERWHRRAVALGGDAHYPPLAYADFLLARGRRAEALRLLANAKDSPEVMRRRARAQDPS